jgi:hypothetical protein
MTKYPFLFLMGMSPQELMDFIKAYDEYVQEFYENHDESSTPVCVAEFYDNDYEVE